MSETPEFPFELDKAFFSKLTFERIPTMPKELHLETKIEITVKEKLPKPVQVTINIKSAESSPLKIDLQLIGLFKYLGNDPDTDKALVERYMNFQGFVVLWPNITQFFRIVTSLMGMNPLNFPSPARFLKLEKQISE